MKTKTLVAGAATFVVLSSGTPLAFGAGASGGSAGGAMGGPTATPGIGVNNPGMSPGTPRTRRRSGPPAAGRGWESTRLSGAQAGAGSDIADPGRQRGLTTAPPATNDSNAPADVNARERQRQDAVIRNQRDASTNDLRDRTPAAQLSQFVSVGIFASRITAAHFAISLLT